MADQPTAMTPVQLAHQVLEDAGRTERETELAAEVIRLSEHVPDAVAWWAVEIEKQRKRLRLAAAELASAPESEHAQDELESAAMVFTHALEGHAEALETAGFGHCDVCGAVTPLDQLHLAYEDTGPVCPPCVDEAKAQAEERRARRRRRKLL